MVATRYDTAVRTAVNFLSVFLGKCGVKNNEEVDYRPLFENFVQVHPFFFLNFNSSLKVSIHLQFESLNSYSAPKSSCTVSNNFD